MLCQHPSIDSYTNDGEYSDTASDSEVSDSENGERKLTSRSFTPISELGSVNGEKKHASDRFQKIKEVKMKIHKDRSGTAVNFGLGIETKEYLRIKAETTKKKQKLAEEASNLRNEEFTIKRHALEATSRLQVAKANMEMMELQKKFKEQNPSCTNDELQCFLYLKCQVLAIKVIILVSEFYVF